MDAEETLALAFDGVRRVGDHNFNRRLWQVHELKMKKKGEIMYSWNTLQSDILVLVIGGII